MINFKCNECGDELVLIRAGNMGFDANLLFEPCGCQTHSEQLYQELSSDLESVANALEVSEEENKEVIDEYQTLLKESKEFKWKKKYKALQHRIDEYIHIANFEKARRIEFQEELKQETRKSEAAQDRLISNHNLDMDELNIRLKGSAMDCKKLMFETDKLKAKLNGGRYKRTVDI